MVPFGRQIKELLEQKQYETIHFISVIVIENVKKVEDNCTMARDDDLSK